MSKFSKIRDNTLKKLIGPSPYVSQLVLWFSSITIRTSLIATNKKEEPNKRIYSATRNFMSELFVLPAALAIGFLSMKAGRKLAKSSINVDGIAGLCAIAGFALANFTIPTLINKSIHKYKFKEKVASILLKENKTEVLANNNLALVGGSKLNVVSKPELTKTYNNYIHHNVKPQFNNNYFSSHTTALSKTSQPKGNLKI